MTKLHASAELPPEFIVHRRIVVSRATGEAILKQISTAEPTPALRELMRDALEGLPTLAPLDDDVPCHSCRRRGKRKRRA